MFLLSPVLSLLVKSPCGPGPKRYVWDDDFVSAMLHSRSDLHAEKKPSLLILRGKQPRGVGNQTEYSRPLARILLVGILCLTYRILIM